MLKAQIGTTITTSIGSLCIKNISGQISHIVPAGKRLYSNLMSTFLQLPLDFYFVERCNTFDDNVNNLNFAVLQWCFLLNAVYSSIVMFYFFEIFFYLGVCVLIADFPFKCNSKNTCWYCDWCYCGSNEHVNKSLEKHIFVHEDFIFSEKYDGCLYDVGRQ